MKKILFAVCLILLFSGCGDSASGSGNPLKLKKTKNVSPKLVEWVRFNDDLFGYFAKSRSKIDGIEAKLMSMYEVSRDSGQSMAELKKNEQFNKLLCEYNSALVIDDKLVDHMLTCYGKNEYITPPVEIRTALGKTRKEEHEELRKIKAEHSSIVAREFNLQNNLKKTLESLKKINYNSQRSALEWQKIHERFEKPKHDAKKSRDSNQEIARGFLNSDFEDKNELYNSFNLLYKKFDELYKELCAAEDQLTLSEYINKCQEVSGVTYQYNRLTQNRSTRLQNLNTLNNLIAQNSNSRNFDKQGYIRQYNYMKSISDEQMKEEENYVRGVEYLLSNNGSHLKELEQKLNQAALNSADLNKMRKAAELLNGINFSSLNRSVSGLANQSEEKRLIETIYGRLIR